MAIEATALPDTQGAIERLLDDAALRAEMGQNGQAAFRTKYNWRIEEGKLRDIYRELFRE